ncbi:hypothetical protein GOV03_02470 [Candidatus Woesearchaeota archaeon]|nr:hypothetical protein [Candidatus Woesearchaeota archaeon]
MDIPTLIDFYRKEKQKLDDTFKTMAQRDLRLSDILSEIEKQSEPTHPDYNNIHKYQEGDEITFNLFQWHCRAGLKPETLTIHISDLEFPIKVFKGTQVKKCYNHWNQYALKKQQEDLENIPF